MKAATFTIVLAVGALAAAPARSQVQEYEHHVTAPGDIIAAWAEWILADGIAYKDYAAGYEIFIRALRAEVALERERWYEIIRRREYKQEVLRAIRAANLQNADRRQAALAEAAALLVADVMDEAYAWPTALTRPEFADAIADIERALTRPPDGWKPGRSPFDRRALHALAANLRYRLTLSPDRFDIAFLDREVAMRTVRQIEFLARWRPESPNLLAAW